MARPSRFWKVAAALYVFINAGGAIFAVASREPMHAASHIALLFVGFAGYAVWRLAARDRSQTSPAAQAPDERMRQLQQSIDALALGVERIGEAQRFTDKLQAERDDSPRGGEKQ